MKLNKLIKYSALSTALIASFSTLALEPGVYSGVETATVTDFRTNASRPTGNTEIEIVVAEDGSYTTNSPFLIRNGLANGSVEDDNGMFHFSDSEDELSFAQYPEELAEFLGFEGLGLFTTAGRSGARWDIQQVSTDVPEETESAESKLAGNWNVSFTGYRYGFSRVTRGYLQLNEDGSFETDITGVSTGQDQEWTVEGDNLILKSTSRRGSSQSGGVGRKVNASVTLSLSELSANQASVDKISTRYLRATYFKAALTR
ncbi:hypothetical protein SOPP22_17160 [Shewanella sp. OPT22]|nr:hypothetical protein SOPP22_17160 [Shewanella sp. OPT22]